MPTQTAILNLETNNSTTDAQQKFLTYRTAQNGVNNSNMTKLDTWAGTVNADITKLKASKPPILVNATWASLGYYTITNTEITEFKLDMIITLKLNIDNDGTTTIKINDLPIKSLMKYGTDGILVNLEAKDLRINHEYNFRYDGTSFVWQGGVSADQITIVGNTDEIITIAEDKTIQNSGVLVSDLATTTYVDTQDDLKVDKTSITASLTETVVGKVSDATVAKTLDDKISILKDVNLNVNKIEISFKPKTYQLKGQMHCHTTSSDGALTPTELLTNYKNAGYDFVSITDHDALNTNVDVDGILHIRGCEYLDGVNHSHVCGYNISKMRDLAETMPSNQGVVDFVKGNGGLVSIPHPTFYGYFIGTEYDDLLNISEYDFIEVYGYGKQDDGHFIDMLLKNGKRINLLAVDDCHDATTTFNNGWIMVNSDSKTKDAIMDEIKKGNYYSSNGNNIAISKSSNIITATSTANSDFYFITDIGTTTTSNALTANYTLTGYETYVRVVSIRVSDGKKAWSNPIFCKVASTKQDNNNMIDMSQIYTNKKLLSFGSPRRNKFIFANNYSGGNYTVLNKRKVSISSGAVNDGGGCGIGYSIYDTSLCNKTMTFSGTLEKTLGNNNVEISVYASNGSDSDVFCVSNRITKLKTYFMKQGEKISFKIDFNVPYGNTGIYLLITQRTINSTFVADNISLTMYQRNVIVRENKEYLPKLVCDMQDVSSLLVNNWTTFTLNTAWQKPNISKVGNLVTASGVVANGIKTTGTVICTLDEIYRPLTQIPITLKQSIDASNFTDADVVLYPNGEVKIYKEFTTNYFIKFNFSYVLD